MTALISWLEAHIPAEDTDPSVTRISHGDYRCGLFANTSGLSSALRMTLAWTPCLQHGIVLLVLCLLAPSYAVHSSVPGGAIYQHQHHIKNLWAPSQAFVLAARQHGIFEWAVLCRLDNLVIHPTKAGRVLAVLDWELSTLGHPFADLAYSAMPYHLPSGIEALPSLPNPLPRGAPVSIPVPCSHPLKKVQE